MPRRKGITNAQAKYLAWLQREAGEQYSGSGLTRYEAHLEIERLSPIRGHEVLDREFEAAIEE